jgi:hypothetical protein
MSNQTKWAEITTAGESKNSKVKNSTELRFPVLAFEFSHLTLCFGQILHLKRKSGNYFHISRAGKTCKQSGLQDQF